MSAVKTYPLRLKILMALVVCGGELTWDDLAELVAEMGRQDNELCPRSSILRAVAAGLIQDRLVEHKPNGMFAITPAGLEIVHNG